MKKLAALSLMIFVGYSAGNAQVERLQGQELTEMLENLGSSTALLPQVDTYIGSPYFTDWVKGYLVLDNNKRTKDMRTRYNMENNSVQFTRDGSIFAVRGNKLKKYVIPTSESGEDIIFKNGFTSKKHEITSDILFRLIYDGSVKLLAFHTSNLLRDVPAYGVAGDVNEFTSSTKFYLVTSNSTFNEIDLNKEDVLEVLPGENKKLQEFVERTNLDYSDQMQIDNILSYYDMLLKAESKNSNL